ncbi:MAG TPA: hypothetical protein VL307_07485 [Chitinophagaceae bacterium]|nr:hypothetical protein [Chitinophagaceae bacterium]
MKPFITLALAIIIANAAVAGSGNPSSVLFPASFNSALKENRSLYSNEGAKVCACQLLRVASRNEKEQLVAVFAQSSNDGEVNADIAAATSVLEKEKKHMKLFFYSSIKMAGSITAATPCSQLYKHIQVKYSNIKMYDVLDADALTNNNLARR